MIVVSPRALGRGLKAHYALTEKPHVLSRRMKQY
jgi:hypothetical protein